MVNKIGKLVLMSALGLMSTTAQAGLIDVKEIVIKSGLVPTNYLQISEVVATQTGTGNDLALISAGATAFGNGNWPGSSPNFAINGAAPAAFPGIFHSDGPGDTEFLRIVLAGVSELDSLTLYGRVGCCSSRDVYNVFLYGETNNLLFSGQNYSANNPLHNVTINLPNTSTHVPEPLSLALLGIGLLGMGISRRNQRGVTGLH